MTSKDNRANLSSMREEYALQTLGKSDVLPHPILQFEKWFNEAVDAKVNEPNAMALGTVSEDGQPRVRIVLLKEIIDHQLCFFTNYTSKKGQEIAVNEQVCLTFFWPELERQVRVEGIAKKLSPEVSDQYFQSRPTGSQIGAWASPQSQPIEDRKIIETNEQMYNEKYRDQKIPRPAYWGGYGVDPNLVEFWQGRRSRLHDRIVYEKLDTEWKIGRLAP